VDSKEPDYKTATVIQMRMQIVNQNNISTRRRAQVSETTDGRDLEPMSRPKT